MSSRLKLKIVDSAKAQQHLFQIVEYMPLPSFLASYRINSVSKVRSLLTLKFSSRINAVIVLLEDVRFKAVLLMQTVTLTKTTAPSVNPSATAGQYQAPMSHEAANAAWNSSSAVDPKMAAAAVVVGGIIVVSGCKLIFEGVKGLYYWWTSETQPVEEGTVQMGQPGSGEELHDHWENEKILHNLNELHRRNQSKQDDDDVFSLINNSNSDSDSDED